MSQFKNISFVFDNKKGSDFNLGVVNIGNSDSLSFFGLDREIIEDDDNLLPVFKGVKHNALSIPITLMHMDKDCNPVSFTSDEKYRINSWLFQNEYKPFMSEDNSGLIYYVIFTKGEKYENGLQQGYLNLTMRMNAGYGFSHIKKDRVVCKTDSGTTKIETFYVKCMDNVVKATNPDIHVKVNEDSKLIIDNFKNGTNMTFNDLKKGMEFICYNDGMKQIVSVSDPAYNMRKHFEGEWLELTQGLNRLQLQGNCEITVIHQDKIALQ